MCYNPRLVTSEEDAARSPTPPLQALLCYELIPSRGVVAFLLHQVKICCEGILYEAENVRKHNETSRTTEAVE